jgi:catechol 2,3-dioxygenase-like lactoylglutathione lyase family enzyme
VRIQFIAGFSPIVDEAARGQRFYRDALGLPLVRNEDNPSYVAMNDFGGAKHFGVWTLADAAQSCFGTREWPASIPRPQATIEFELATPAEVESGAREMEALGYSLIHGIRVEPWGQAVARLLGPEGLLIGLSFAPWLHEPA